MRAAVRILKNPIILHIYSCIRAHSLCNVRSHSFHLKQGVPAADLQITKIQKSPYYIEDGLRKVYPYYYTHTTYCKGRWIKRKLIDVYCDEFALYPREEYEIRISKGILKVNNEVVKQDYILKSGDFVSALIHRHELAVLACPVNILFEDKDFLIVDKPPSIPVHPCGLYRQNSLIHILANDYGIHNLHVTHRLDRMTSGIVIFAKSVEKSREIHTQMNLRKVNKEYVCRVEGNFPDEPIICNKPIKHAYHKMGVALIHPEGKISVTEFKKISYNGKSSLVLCRPLTGRTHQIRVHLQYLGHPIINDSIYNSSAFGPNKGKNGVIDKPITQLLDDLFLKLTSELDSSSDNKSPDEIRNNFLCFSVFKMHYNMNTFLPKYKKDCGRINDDKDCYYCKFPNQDPVQGRLGLFLHAFKYQGENWEFKADMPFWASKNWNVA